jgi:hypothetical protein
MTGERDDGSLGIARSFEHTNGVARLIPENPIPRRAATSSSRGCLRRHTMPYRNKKPARIWRDPATLYGSNEALEIVRALSKIDLQPGWSKPDAESFVRLASKGL